jgi:glutaredoxin
LTYAEKILDIGQEKLPDREYVSREQLLELVPDAKTVPQIFYYDTYIGGYTELSKLAEEWWDDKTTG